MGEFGYIYGYMLVFVFCLGVVLGFIRREKRWDYSAQYTE